MNTINDNTQPYQALTNNHALKVKRANGRYTEATDSEILQEAKRVFSQQLFNGDSLTTPKQLKDYLNAHYRLTPYEVFSLILLTTQHKIINHVEITRGTIDSATVHPREVVREVIKANASAVILAHNHPSGSIDISYPDKLITEKIKNVLSLIDVRVLDHFIVADSVVSFAEQGLL